MCLQLGVGALDSLQTNAEKFWLELAGKCYLLQASPVKGTKATDPTLRWDTLRALLFVQRVSRATRLALLPSPRCAR